MEDRKEELYLTVIQNLIKKSNFDELHNQLDNKEITENKYLKEIDEHPEKYVLEMKEMDDPQDLFLIKEIMGKLDRNVFIDELMLHEVADLFSLSSETIEEALEKLEDKDENS